jgi:hypothetical protein
MMKGQKIAGHAMNIRKPVQIHERCARTRFDQRNGSAPDVDVSVLCVHNSS